MNVTRIRAENFRSYEAIDVKLPSGCLAVVGSNGAGKSSLVEAIPLTIFGPEGRSLAPYLNEDETDASLVLEVEFEHAGDDYRIRRTYSPRGRGQTKVDFEQHVDGSWMPLTAESAAATQDVIESVLKLSRETFCASAYLGQGRGGQFTEAQPRDRKRILADVIGLDVWERLWTQASADRRTAERQLGEIAGRIAFLEEQGGDVATLEGERDADADTVEIREHAHAGAERALVGASEKLAELTQFLTARAARVADVSAAGARLTASQAVIDRAAAAKTEAVQIQVEVDRVGDVGARLASLEDDRAEMDAARERRREQESTRDRYIADAEDTRRAGLTLATERSHIEKEIGILKVKAQTLKAGTCDRCGQAVHGEAFETAQLRLHAEHEEAERRVTAYTVRIDELGERERSRKAAAEEVAIPDTVSAENYDDVIEQIKEARKVELVIGAARERLAMLQAAVAEVTPELTAEVALLATALVDARSDLAEIPEPDADSLDEARSEALLAKARLDGVVARLTESRAALVRAEAALEQARKFALELEEADEKRRGFQGEIDLLAILERAYGRDGIPALIVEASAIPSIETEANRILAELGTSYRVELRTQRALKSGDGLADTLDVVVIADAGERPYETFSGGEKTRLNLALRIALARLLANRRGAESRLLAIDEPEFLDEAGTARLADVLRGLDQEFDRIVLVSHVPTLRDAFDQTIEVVKEDGRSLVIA